MRQNPASLSGTKSEPDVDVVIIGAGMAGLYQLHRVRELGMRTLRDDGARKVMLGLTSIAEILRVTQDDMLALE